MRFQPVKCNMMQLTNKTLNKIQASYTLEGTVLENVDNIKYLGVTCRHGRYQHSLAFQIPSASKDVYMYSFFPQTIRDWNNLPESLISSSELSDDSVSKFTSLVRARD